MAMKQTLVLATVNARYYHTSVGLRCLYANMGTLKDRTLIMEFESKCPAERVATAILSKKPVIVGLGVYIWNHSVTAQIAEQIKTVNPAITLIAGGPEVSWLPPEHPLLSLFDYIIPGEADAAFAQLCSDILLKKHTRRGLQYENRPDLHTLFSPCMEYSDEDLAQRITYIEASRGCPCRCDYCLSARESGVRFFPMETVLKNIDKLVRRGARQFNFIDRSFNRMPTVWRPVLQGLLQYRDVLRSVHFEFTGDLLPDELKTMLVAFPPGLLQLEVGVQTLNEEVNELINRQQDSRRTLENLDWLTRSSGAHIHVDMIAGLPTETEDSIAATLNALVRMQPHEIQVGTLKKLPGTPLHRHIAPHEMVFDETPPYTLLSSSTLSASTVKAIQRFAAYWNLYYNRQHFPRSLPFLWKTGSPYRDFMKFTAYLSERLKKTHSIALNVRAELLYRYLVDETGLEESRVSHAIMLDYCDGGRRRPPPFVGLERSQTFQPHLHQ